MIHTFPDHLGAVDLKMFAQMEASVLSIRPTHGVLAPAVRGCRVPDCKGCKRLFLGDVRFQGIEGMNVLAFASALFALLTAGTCQGVEG